MTENLDIRSMDLIQLWEVFKSESTDLPELSYTDVYRQVRNGVKIRFDINYYTKGFAEINVKKDSVIIGTRQFKFKDFHDELELRERLMKNYLISLEPNKSIAPRQGLRSE